MRLETTTILDQTYEFGYHCIVCGYSKSVGNVVFNRAVGRIRRVAARTLGRQVLSSLVKVTIGCTVHWLI